MAEYYKKDDVDEIVHDTLFTMSMCLTLDECKGMNAAKGIIADLIDSLPVEEMGLADKITLCDAMENPAWLMVYAAEPERNIEVKMTYADLYAVYEWVRKARDGDGVSLRNDIRSTR